MFRTVNYICQFCCHNFTNVVQYSFFMLAFVIIFSWCCVFDILQHIPLNCFHLTFMYIICMLLELSLLNVLGLLTIAAFITLYTLFVYRLIVMYGILVVLFCFLWPLVMFCLSIIVELCYTCILYLYSYWRQTDAYQFWAEGWLLDILYVFYVYGWWSQIGYNCL